MKKSIKFLIVIALVVVSLVSCKKDDLTDDVVLKDILITTTKTASTIKLSWKPVDGCSWYHIYCAKSGEVLELKTDYQDLTNNPITYTITGLTANTSYDIKMIGTDYLIGGKEVASKILHVTTEP